MEQKHVYQLKVTLNGLKPPIWRWLLLPSSATFWELHIAIQDSFGWTDTHLHQFFIGSNRRRIAIPHPDDELYMDIEEPYDESMTKLSEVFSEKQQKVTYEYDFGDGWMHSVVLEKVLPVNPDEAYPQVIAGKRSCPWEDSGGPWGYQEKIEILRDRKHEYHEEIFEWVGLDDINDLDISLEHFDPEDVTFRNAATELQKVKNAIAKGY